MRNNLLRRCSTLDATMYWHLYFFFYYNLTFFLYNCILTYIFKLFKLHFLMTNNLIVIFIYFKLISQYMDSIQQNKVLCIIEE